MNALVEGFVPDEKTRELLQEIADVLFWGPRGPGSGDAILPGTSELALNAPFRIGCVIGQLIRLGVRPTDPPAPPGAAS